MRKTDNIQNGDASPFSNHYAVFPMLLWDPLCAPATLQTLSALAHSHRRPKYPEEYSGLSPRSDVVEWWCY